MYEKTPRLAPKVRKLHAHLLRRPRSRTGSFLLSDESFRFAANCERMRVDRNGSVLSMLLIRLSDREPDEVGLLARILEGRLRVTDTPGLLSDGRVAVLLPDTPEEGAWKVAQDISEVYPPGPGRPECEVLVYPGSRRDKREGREVSDRRRSPRASQQAPRAPQSPQDRRRGTNRKPQSPGESFFARPLPRWKRALDLLGGSAGLLASLPVLAGAGLLIKATSPGPILFTQQRAGLGGRPFTIWKLRTMHVDAEQQKKQLRQHSQQDGPAFKLEQDPRTTTVGRWLRWSSVDELPQFWNVLTGQMSLVGPRPLPVEESAACEDWQRRRLQVTPGMTCIWQVEARGAVSFDEWVRMDLRYARRRSLLTDLGLLARTLPSLLSRRGMR